MKFRSQKVELTNTLNVLETPGSSDVPWSAYDSAEMTQGMEARRLGLVVGVGSFTQAVPAPLEEPGPGTSLAWDPLEFAEERVREVADALTALGVALHGAGWS